MLSTRKNNSDETTRSKRSIAASGPRNRKLSPADHPDIWEMYAKGWSQREIAKHYGVTQARISQILSGLSVDMPQVSREEMIATFLAGCRELYESAMHDVRNAPAQYRSQARRDAQMILDRLAQIAAMTKYPIAAPDGSEALRYVIMQDGGDDDVIKALRLCHGSERVATETASWFASGSSAQCAACATRQSSGTCSRMTGSARTIPVLRNCAGRQQPGCRNRSPRQSTNWTSLRPRHI
jgi:transcriptional regulator with XRE-family HTH domain